jgi:acetyl esterase/lipase
MKKILLSLALSIAFAANAQQVIRLYPGKAPGSEDWTQKESEFTHPQMTGLMVRNVVDPTLTVFKPSKPNGTAVIVCPGGGFHWLSYQSEGVEVAQWLAARGVTAFVLKYRLVNTGPTMDDLNKAAQRLFTMVSAGQKKGADSGKVDMSSFMAEMKNTITLAVADGAEAMKYVRQHATGFSVDPNKIGMIGFSAGAGVEQGTILKGDPLSEPNFAGHIYGGDTGDAKIPDDAPPLFILSANDDPISAGNPDLIKHWKAAGKQVELHIYAKGGHGFGMKKQGLPVDSWIERFGDWMGQQGFLPGRTGMSDGKL